MNNKKVQEMKILRALACELSNGLKKNINFFLQKRGILLDVNNNSK